MRVRLRPAYSDADLAQIYARPHDHSGYPDHVVRVEHTISLGKALCRLVRTTPVTVADLSCGDGVIARAFSEDPVLGDLAPGYPVTGPVEQTLARVGEDGPVDLFVFCETAEHLDDPDEVLTLIRHRARLLLMSTPLGETTDENPEHYWGWDQAGVGQMLAAAGWDPVIWSTVTMPNASFQIWGCQQ